MYLGASCELFHLSPSFAPRQGGEGTHGSADNVHSRRKRAIRGGTREHTGRGEGGEGNCDRERRSFPSTSSTYVRRWRRATSRRERGTPCERRWNNMVARCCTWSLPPRVHRPANATREATTKCRALQARAQKRSDHERASRPAGGKLEREGGWLGADGADGHSRARTRRTRGEPRQVARPETVRRTRARSRVPRMQARTHVRHACARARVRARTHVRRAHAACVSFLWLRARARVRTVCIVRARARVCVRVLVYGART